MRRLLFIPAFLLGAGLLAVLLEFALRLLPVPSGSVAGAPDPAWPAHHLEKNRDTVSSLAWNLEDVQRGHVNNLGYLAPFDYVDGAQVGIVIGDSFIEGYTNPYRDLLQAQLADELGLPQQGVYSFGTSAASLAHYLGVARLAGSRFRPSWAVVLVSTYDFDEGFQPLPGYYGWTDGDQLIALQPEEQRSALKSAIRESALVNYVRRNLKFSAKMMTSDGFDHPNRPARCPDVSLTDNDRRLIDGWVAALPQALHLPPERTVLVFDSDRYLLYRTKPLRICPEHDGLARDRLQERARAIGVAVVDTKELFQHDWEAHHLPLDRLPVDGHWNARAHKMVADAVAARLRAATKPYN